MRLQDALLAALDAHKNQVLRIAQAALPQSQFNPFRGLFLDEFGRNGYASDVERIVAEHERQGKNAGQADTCRKGGAP